MIRMVNTTLAVLNIVDNKSEYRGQQIFWKIDMYDLNYEFYSPQPDDETQTNRVLTIMFADEY